MYSAVQVVREPALEPVSVNLARLHLRVDHLGDDRLIALYISSARTWAEMFLGRVLVSTQLLWTLSHDQPPNGFPFMSMPLSLLVLPMWFRWPLQSHGIAELPWRPVLSVDAVSYGQWGQDDVVLTAGADYDVDVSSARLRIHPYSEVLPNDHMQVKFTAGYGTTENAVPAPIISAILLLTGFLYEHRGDAGGDMPPAAEALLTPYRLVRFG